MLGYFANLGVVDLQMVFVDATQYLTYLQDEDAQQFATWAHLESLSKAFQNVLAFLLTDDGSDELVGFLLHFIQAVPPSALFQHYVGEQFGGGPEAIGGANMLMDNTVRDRFAWVMNRLRALSVDEEITRDYLNTIAKLLERTDLNVELELVQQFFGRGQPAAGAERISLLKRAIRQLQVVDLFGLLEGGLYKLKLDALLTAVDDPMAQNLGLLRGKMNGLNGRIRLTSFNRGAEHESLAVFHELSGHHLDVLRKLDKFDDIRGWLVSQGFLMTDAGESSFRSRVNFVNQLLVVSVVYESSIFVLSRLTIYNRVQGEDRGTRIMTALEQARPAVLLLHQPISLSSLVRSIKGLTQHHVASMFTCAQHSTEIQEWFDENVSHTYGEVMASLDAVQSNGIATFVVEGDSVVFRLQYEIVRGSQKISRKKQGSEIKVVHACSWP